MILSEIIAFLEFLRLILLFLDIYSACYNALLVTILCYRTLHQYFATILLQYSASYNTLLVVWLLLHAETAKQRNTASAMLLRACILKDLVALVRCKGFRGGSRDFHAFSHRSSGSFTSPLNHEQEKQP